ncbi:ZF-HD homeobox protein [Acorus calamus]|uniref:ZF-HD homeobox protein n=1 Tax=Acorus calamus TaxID=4465 RepID=A0AAV9E9W1_ACOCL|nr:ZF-HD homeobox protein [Acorus calamus]
MDLHEPDIPMPISSSYGGGGGVGSHFIHPSSTPSNGPLPPPPPPHHPLPSPSILLDIDTFTTPTNITTTNKKKKNVIVKYKECLKNHAAARGGNATDGCGEFMPSGEEGTLEALKCSACNCHRNFHRKDIEGCASNCDCYLHPTPLKATPSSTTTTTTTKKVVGQKGVLISGGHQHHHHEPFGYGHHHQFTTRPPTPPHPPPPHMIMPYNMVGSESDEQDFHTRPSVMIKKRFRTKFTQDQKEKMLGFAEKVGWKIQKQEESVVQQFCQEVGVKRRVLKVWMHNNKHNFAKKSPTSPNNLNE